MLHGDFLIINFGVKIGAAEAVLAWQPDADEMKRGVARVGEAVFGSDSEAGRIARDKAHSKRFLLDFITRSQGNGAATK